MTPTNVPMTINVLANDYDLQGDQLTVTHILDQPVAAGSVITLDSGVTVTVGADGNLTVAGDGTNAVNDVFTYHITDGNGGSSVAYVQVTMSAAVPNPPPAFSDPDLATGPSIDPGNSANLIVPARTNAADAPPRRTSPIRTATR